MGNSFCFELNIYNNLTRSSFGTQLACASSLNPQISLKLFLLTFFCLPVDPRWRKEAPSKVRLSNQKMRTPVWVCSSEKLWVSSGVYLCLYDKSLLWLSTWFYVQFCHRSTSVDFGVVNLLTRFFFRPFFSFQWKQKDRF